jgi:hypothetical protein
MRTYASTPSTATSRQLAYLRSLASQTGTTFTTPHTGAQASREIDRLLHLLKAKDGVPFRREPSIASDPLVYATAPHPDETAGFGSSAHWRSTPQRDPESLPEKSDVGERTELSRYTISSGERVLCGQRIKGCVRLTDRPATGSGRSYLIERELENDGYEALKALIADYTRQAHASDEIPMVSSVIRRELQEH